MTLTYKGLPEWKPKKKEEPKKEEPKKSGDDKKDAKAKV